jgi:acyl carrier protein
MFNIEDEFHIKLPDERVEIKTIQDIASIVERLVSEQKTAS